MGLSNEKHIIVKNEELLNEVIVSLHPHKRFFLSEEEIEKKINRIVYLYNLGPQTTIGSINGMIMSDNQFNLFISTRVACRAPEDYRKYLPDQQMQFFSELAMLRLLQTTGF
jgi:hypothetical protein